MKKSFTIALSLLFLTIMANAQFETVEQINKKVQEIDKGTGYVSEQVVPGGYCVMIVDILKKAGKVAKIILTYQGNAGGYDYEYFFNNGEVFYVHTKDCTTIPPDDDGIMRSECFEYNHYYNSEGCFYSIYKQGEYKFGEEPDITELTFLDIEKSCLEMQRADKYLKAYTTDDWSEVCN